jgi:hypothetical protein
MDVERFSVRYIERLLWTTAALPHIYPGRFQTPRKTFNILGN